MRNVNKQDLENNSSFFYAHSDKFDVTDADGSTDQWTAGYVNGAAGGSADINTTTAGKARVQVVPSTSAAAAYTMKYAKTIKGRYWSIISDVDTAFGTQAASWAAIGLRVSNSTYDNTNIIYIERQESSTSPYERIVGGSNFNGAGATETAVTDSADSYAFKIERIDDVFNLYYSKTKSPNYNWVLVESFLDTLGDIPDEVGIHLLAYSPGNSATQSAYGDFDNFKVYYNIAGVISFLLDLYKQEHMANKVYPTGEAGAEVISSPTAWTLGSFKEIVPVDTITNSFDIHFINIEGVSAAGTYEIYLYAGTTLIGTARFTAVGTPNNLVFVSKRSQSAEMLANTQIQAKVMSSNAVADTVTISLEYHVY